MRNFEATRRREGEKTHFSFKTGLFNVPFPHYYRPLPGSASALARVELLPVPFRSPGRRAARVMPVMASLFNFVLRKPKKAAF